MRIARNSIQGMRFLLLLCLLVSGNPGRPLPVPSALGPFGEWGFRLRGALKLDEKSKSGPFGGRHSELCRSIWRNSGPFGRKFGPSGGHSGPSGDKVGVVRSIRRQKSPFGRPGPSGETYHRNCRSIRGIQCSVHFTKLGFKWNSGPFGRNLVHSAGFRSIRRRMD